MKQSLFITAMQATSLLLVSRANAQTSTSLNLKPIQTLACYKSADPLVLDMEYQYMTDGWCQEQCGALGKPVMAITAGSTCYCGDQIPPVNQQVASSNCNSPCNGYGDKYCGGLSYWQVYLTGLTTNVQTAANNNTSSSSSSGGSSSLSASPSVITKAGETVVVTASSSPSSQSGGSPSKVGVAVGVVVGTLAIAAIIGGLVFFLKQRRRRAIEEEHKRNAAINEFVGKKSETSSTDQRLDPVIFSHRRESIGSIADEMDYSRRILQVRNPDHRASQASANVS